MSKLALVPGPIAWLALLGSCAVPLGPERPDARAHQARAPSCDRTPRGLPFRIAPGVSAAGYGLNTNDDGIQNFGEVAVDCGGAGDASCVATVPLDVRIATSTRHVVSGFEIEFQSGTINGRSFQMQRPLPGQQLPYDDHGLIAEWPTRSGTQHEPPDPPFVLGQTELVLGQHTGAVAIAMEGVTGQHPYTFSAQDAVLAARYLREVVGVQTVVAVGPSYGGATALAEAALYPEFIDGALSMGSPYDARRFVAWS